MLFPEGDHRVRRQGKRSVLGVVNARSTRLAVPDGGCRGVGARGLCQLLSTGSCSLFQPLADPKAGSDLVTGQWARASPSSPWVQGPGEEAPEEGSGVPIGPGSLKPTEEAQLYFAFSSASGRQWVWGGGGQAHRAVVRGLPAPEPCGHPPTLRRGPPQSLLFWRGRTQAPEGATPAPGRPRAWGSDAWKESHGEGPTCHPCPLRRPLPRGFIAAPRPWSKSWPPLVGGRQEESRLGMGVWGTWGRQGPRAAPARLPWRQRVTREAAP